MFPSRITGHSFSPEMPPRWMMPSTPATICSTAGISESSVRSTSSPSRAGASATRSERRKIGYRPRKVSRSERPMPPPAPVIRTRFIRFLLGVHSRLHQKSPPIDKRLGKSADSFILLQCRGVKIGNSHNVSGCSDRASGEQEAIATSGRSGKCCAACRGKPIGPRARAMAVSTQHPKRGVERRPP